MFDALYSKYIFITLCLTVFLFKVLESINSFGIFSALSSLVSLFSLHWMHGLSASVVPYVRLCAKSFREVN